MTGPGALLRERLRREPDGLGIAPGRVNLIGEHTDHQGGPCLPFAIGHATRAAVALRDDGRIRLASAQSDVTWQGLLSDVGPGSPEGWPGFAAGTAAFLHQAGWQARGLDIAVDGDVPLGAGLSSSAALECAVGAALADALQIPWDRAARDAVAAAGIAAEASVVGAPTGGMDQMASVHARAGHALLLDFAAAAPDPAYVPLDLAAAGLAVLMVDTRVSHDLADGAYARRRQECAEASTALGVERLAQLGSDAALGHLDDPVLRRRARHVVTEGARVAACVEALRAGDWSQVGALMTASHASLRDDFEVSCDELDAVVERATQRPGVLGARMTGGGFGGSAIVLCRQSVADDLAVRLARPLLGAAPVPEVVEVRPSAGARPGA